MELLTVQEFKDYMKIHTDEVFCNSTIKVKIREKYGSDVDFVNREGKSDIILLGNLKRILTEEFYNKRKSEPQEEALRIITAAARIIKNDIKNHQVSTDKYPTVDEITDAVNICVPMSLHTLLKELISNPLKQSSIGQAVFSATQPKSVMPLQFGLAIATDNRLSSKWLSILLSKLGFSVSYDEVGLIHYICLID